MAANFLLSWHPMWASAGTLAVLCLIQFPASVPVKTTEDGTAKPWVPTPTGETQRKLPASDWPSSGHCGVRGVNQCGRSLSLFPLCKSNLKVKIISSKIKQILYPKISPPK